MAIQHTVVFRLHHAPESAEPDAFFADARALLAAIPGVQDFTVRRQVSAASAFTHQFSIVFEDDEAYRRYNEHPVHSAFVAERWVPEVAEFQEYDFVDEPAD